MTLLRLPVALLAAVVLSSACGGGGPARPSSPPGPSGFRQSNENVLPETFPPDLPLPADRRVVLSQVSAQATVVYFGTSSTYSQVRELMLAKLPENGWAILFCAQIPSPGPTTTLVATKGDVVAAVNIGTVPDPRGDLPRYQLFVSVTRGPRATPPTTSAC